MGRENRATEAFTPYPNAILNPPSLPPKFNFELLPLGLTIKKLHGSHAQESKWQNQLQVKSSFGAGSFSASIGSLARFDRNKLRDDRAFWPPWRIGFRWGSAAICWYFQTCRRR
jgi:hypothetical protein